MKYNIEVLNVSQICVNYCKHLVTLTSTNVKFCVGCLRKVFIFENFQPKPLTWVEMHH